MFPRRQRAKNKAGKLQNSPPNGGLLLFVPFGGLLLFVPFGGLLLYTERRAAALNRTRRRKAGVRLVPLFKNAAGKKVYFPKDCLFCRKTAGGTIFVPPAAHSAQCGA